MISLLSIKPLLQLLPLSTLPIIPIVRNLTYKILILIFCCLGNLSGDAKTDIQDHMLQVKADEYTPTDELSIPSGEFASVEGTPFDLREPVRLGDIIGKISGGGQPGLDHNYVVSKSVQNEIQMIATCSDPKSGRKLVLYGTQPGVQVYTGNFLNGSPPFAQHYGFCLETQYFPDSINQPNFPDIILRPGEKYRHEAIFSLRHVRD